MPAKKRKVDQMDMVSSSITKANRADSPPPQEAASLPDPYAGNTKAYGISMRIGLYASLRHVSNETGIPLARLVEQGALMVLDKYGYRSNGS